MTPKLYKAGEVCELLQVQPYVLRSWEKEFPGIGVQKSPESPRVYRQSDVDHVQRIKQLVFGEGLTLSGARRRLEESAPVVSAVTESEAAEVLESLGDDVRERIAVVRDGLRALQSLLSGAPGSSKKKIGSSNGKPGGRGARPAGTKRKAGQREFRLKPPPAKSARPKARTAASRSKTVKRGTAVTVVKASSARKKSSTKRKRARA